MGITCPNTNLQEWKDLVDIHGENVAYGIWDAYKEGIPIEFYRTSNKSDDAIFKRQVINEINKRAKDTFNLTKDIVTYYKEGDIYTIVKGTGSRDKSPDTLEITNKLRLENILEQMTLELGYSPFFITTTKNGKTFKVVPNDIPKVKYEAITTPVEVPDLENMDDISEYYQKQTTSNEGIIAAEKTIRDLAARMADRIGMKIKFESDRSKDYKGKIENNTAVINLAYATLDTAIHEVLGHSIIRVLKNKSNLSSKEQLKQQVEQGNIEKKC